MFTFRVSVEMVAGSRTALIPHGWCEICIISGSVDETRSSAAHTVHPLHIPLFCFVIELCFFHWLLSCLHHVSAVSRFECRFQLYG